MGELEGNTAVVTGAASGIGRATAELFVNEGVRVVIGDILTDAGEALADELGERVRFREADVTEEADVRDLVDFAVDEFGSLDVMINNAGVGGPRDPVAETDTDEFDHTLDVHLRGVFLGMKHAARVMLPEESGCILSTASVAAFRTGYAPHAYSAAKAGIVQLTRSVATELGESGVRVNCVCPGGVVTPIFGRALGLDQQQSLDSTDVLEAGLAERQPIKRAGQPEDVAKAFRWLAAEDSAFVNGHALVVDGGGSAGRMWSETQETWDTLEQFMTASLEDA